MRSLPKRIERLGELAYNLWWTWRPDAQSLFQRIDPVLWESLEHNPVRFLRQAARKDLNAVAKDKRFLDLYDRVLDDLDRYVSPTGEEATWLQRNHPDFKGQIGYFSFEFGIHECLPLYAGGLGVLAGDHLKEASDLGLPLVGVGFMYLLGYFRQRVTEDGWQEADYDKLDFADLPVTAVNGPNGEPIVVALDLPNRSMRFRIWLAQVGRVPLYLLDADLPENRPQDRALTQRLYNPDPDTRIPQEVLLGIGGVRALRAMDVHPTVWHMNEGHPAFLTLERAREMIDQEGISFDDARQRVRASTVFTTHTPVPAGNDTFAQWQIDRQLWGFWDELGLSRDQFMDLAEQDGLYGMTVLALRMASKANGVSKLHGEVASDMWAWMFPKNPRPIDYITNGIHVPTWVSRRMKRLYDQYLGTGWMDRVMDHDLWKAVYDIPDSELWTVRKHYKRMLVSFMRDRARRKWVTHTQHPVQTIASGALVEPGALMIGFARRFPTYKRATMILRDIPRLVRLITDPARPVQILYAGKSHPNDEPGKRLIQDLYRVIKNADTAGRMVFIEDYDMNVARYLVHGVDVWMNTPRRPHEASGTSGMKAALNGALNFSILDGWWPEAWNGKNGWRIGTEQAYATNEEQDIADSRSLFDTLENEIIPLYYDIDEDLVPHRWLQWVKESIYTCAPEFSTMRMVSQYFEQMYRPVGEAARRAVA
ncbi:MAG: alpha-glucan family phosphorylase [Thermoflexales bacterium]|nr:alpha-glucan family phosphorylase [Thermoflexales bacterium]